MRAFIIIPSLITLAALQGCIRASEISLADGSVAHEIDCDGRRLSIETCFDRAAEICGANGFETVTKDGTSTGRMPLKGSTDINSGAFETRTILVRCKNDRPVPKY